jgi:ribosomal protein S18 acetylase RimI-like enzyme
MQIVKRPVVADQDHEFLLALYTAARQVEMQSFNWSSAELTAFARMQFQLQQRSYALLYPHASHSILSGEGTAIGQLRVARSSHGMVLLDVSLLPAFRARGIGSALIRELCQEARREGLVFELSVRPDNRAQRLYRRLGFRESRRDSTNTTMVWRAAAQNVGTRQELLMTSSTPTGAGRANS